MSQVGDPTEWGMQPLGKQRAWGTGGILYTSTSGIWGALLVVFDTICPPSIVPTAPSVASIVAMSQAAYCTATLMLLRANHGE